MPARCIKCNVTQANFNYAGEKAQHCAKRKSPNMVDVKNPKCASSHCPQQANHKYDKYCLFCFINFFPKDERPIKAINTRKELHIVIHIIHRFKQQFEFVFNKPLHVDFDGGCCATKRGIDLRTTIYNTTIAIELDEDQRKNM